MSFLLDAGSSGVGLGAQASSLTEPTFEKNPERLDGQKHFSIDLSLELERQLELEGSSLPATPSSSKNPHSYAQPNPDTLDPQILVHIITGLRKTIEDMTKERDDLIKMIEDSTTREATLQDTLALMTEKATNYEEELSAAKKKMKEDEEAITLLRTKVEESRRGIMRLQAESRRQSAAPSAIDLSRAAIPGISSPPSSKRASFTPLTGRSNSHRRVSSISGTGDGNGLGLLHVLSSDTQPNGPLSFQDSSASGLGPPGSRRSLFFRNSPPKSDAIPLPPTNVSTSSEFEAIKKELEGLKRELVDTRVELSEANEAKEASESCAKALREFIAGNQVGESSMSGKSLPPPIAIIGDSSDRKSAASNSGWGFKLWKADSNITPSSTRQPPPPPTSAPFSRLGGFFSSRASAVSTVLPGSTLQTNAAAVTRESFLDSSSGRSVKSMSDESSVVEPASPRNECSGHVKVVDAPEVGESGGVLEIPMEKDDDTPIQHQHGVTVAVV